jgi:hypothetical protein
MNIEYDELVLDGFCGTGRTDSSFVNSQQYLYLFINFRTIFHDTMSR